eukprot:424668-Pleurochrysis_carterae.AAC.2
MGREGGRAFSAHDGGAISSDIFRAPGAIQCGVPMTEERFDAVELSCARAKAAARVRPAHVRCACTRERARRAQSAEQRQARSIVFLNRQTPAPS